MSTPPSDDNALLTNLSRKVETLEHDIRGNGDKGIKQRVARIESHMFQNTSTGDPGIVRKVYDHESLINGVRAQMRTLNWLMGLLGTGGIIFLLRVIFGSVN